MADVSVDVHNGGVAVDSELVVKGLDHVVTDSKLASTSKLDSTGRVTIDPLSSTAAVGIDLQPVAVDTCVRVELAPPPPTVLRTPWSSRIGLSWWGVELVAVCFSGEVRNHLEPAPRTPQVLGTVEQHPGVTVRLGP